MEPGFLAEDEVLALLMVLKENPWDTIDLHYDAGDWLVTLHEDGAQTKVLGPHPDLLSLLRQAVLF